MIPDILEALQKDPRVYSNFLAFPRLYRHVRLDTIQIKKNQPELFHSLPGKVPEEYPGKQDVWRMA